MKKMLIVCIVTVVIISSCSYPIVEGSMENASLLDFFFYIYKIVFGPISRDYDEKAFTLEEVNEYDFTMTVFGDIMFYSPLLNCDELFKEVPSELLESDLVFTNLEFPVHDKKPTSGFPWFNGSLEYFEKIVLPLNPDVLNLANNHCFDKDIEGLSETVSLLDRYNIESIGLKRDNRFSVVNINGISVALSGYTYGTNVAKDKGNEIINISRLNAVNLYTEDFSEIKSVIRRMKEVNDVIILSLHWGLEYELTPTKNQVELARMLCDEGVDILIGHHPHVLQPIEQYENKRGTTSLIIYSLGNWTTAMIKKYCRVNSPLKLYVTSKGKITKIEAFPFIFDRQGKRFLKLEDTSLIPQSIASFVIW
ncbi:MAG: CapA family protein [Kosmotogaceae bacterium]